MYSSNETKGKIIEMGNTVQNSSVIHGGGKGADDDRKKNERKINVHSNNGKKGRTSSE